MLHFVITFPIHVHEKIGWNVVWYKEYLKRFLQDVKDQLDCVIVWKLEFHKSGYPHWHLLFEYSDERKFIAKAVVLHVSNILNEFDFTEEQKEDFIKFQFHEKNLSNVQENDIGIKYVSKYIDKEESAYSDYSFGRYWGIINAQRMQKKHFEVVCESLITEENILKIYLDSIPHDDEYTKDVINRCIMTYSKELIVYNSETTEKIKNIISDYENELTKIPF